MIGVDYHLDCAALRYGFVRCHRAVAEVNFAPKFQAAKNASRKMKNDKARATIIKPSYISYN